MFILLSATLPFNVFPSRLQWWQCGGGDQSDSAMSLSGWKGNCFKGDQTAKSEAATGEREGSPRPWEHLTPPPHPSILNTPPCFHLASRSCMANAIAITASSFSCSLSSSFLPSFKAPLGSLFRNYNHSGFRQFDQMLGLHVRIEKGGGGV